MVATKNSLKCLRALVSQSHFKWYPKLKIKGRYQDHQNHNLYNKENLHIPTRICRSTVLSVMLVYELLELLGQLNSIAYTIGLHNSPSFILFQSVTLRQPRIRVYDILFIANFSEYAYNRTGEINWRQLFDRLITNNPSEEPRPPTYQATPSLLAFGLPNCLKSDRLPQLVQF